MVHSRIAVDVQQRSPSAAQHVEARDPDQGRGHP